MNAAVGESALLLAFGAALAGCVTTVTGLLRHRPNLLRAGRTYAWVVLAGALAATAAMQHALITRDFSLSYVAGNDSLSTPLLFRVTAMWSNLSGSILLWGLVLAGYLAAMAYRFRHRFADPLVAWASVVGYGVCLFFFGLMLTASNPFEVVRGQVPTDGPGPNPLLQDHILVAFHPPLLYLGLVGFTVPFAFACAGLITGRVGEGWMVETRRWTLFAWGFLTVGVILGAWWSYEVLGWGGYWAWDPVENAAFLPWLTGTAFLHSVMIQERRGMLRVWNLSLVAATFSLTVLATFLTRSGVLDSVHAFDNTGIGPALLGFFGVVVAGAIGLLAWRGDLLRAPGAVESPLSREGAFLANNLLFGAFAVVVLLGTVFPLVVQAVNNDQITVGAPYFDRMTMPVVVCLLFLMAVAPVLSWRKTSPGVLRARLLWPACAAVAVLGACVAGGLRGFNPLLAFGLATFAGASALRQLVVAARSKGWRALTGASGGGMVVHLGVVLLAVGFAASHSYAHRTQLTLRTGQTATFDGHSFTFLGTESTASSSHTSLVARVKVDGGRVFGPAVNDYPFASEPIGTPSVHSGPFEDVYLTIATTPPRPGGAVVIGVIVEPLVSWIWIGGAVMLTGTALAVAGRPRRRGARRAEGRSGAEPADGDPADGEPAAAVGHPGGGEGVDPDAGSPDEGVDPDAGSPDAGNPDAGEGERRPQPTAAPA